MTQGDVLLRLITRMPSSAQISDLDTDKDANVIRFAWRGTKYRIDYSLDHIMVEEVQGSLLASTDRAELIKELLKRGV